MASAELKSAWQSKFWLQQSLYTQITWSDNLMTTAFKMDYVLRKILCLSPNNQVAEVGEITVLLKVVEKVEKRKFDVAVE